jgi:hypothetical protein
VQRDFAARQIRHKGRQNNGLAAFYRGFQPAAAKPPELLADSTACGNRQGAISASCVFCRDVAEVSQDSRGYFAKY